VRAMTENESLKRRCEAAEALCELAGELLRLNDYDQILDTLVQRSLAILGAERGFLVLTHGEALEFRVVRNWSHEELEAAKDPVSRTIVAEALRAREPLLVQDALTDPRFAQSESVARLNIRSVLAAPLLIDGQPVGALYLESRSVENLFMREHLDRFRRILDLSSHALEGCTKRLVMEQRLQLLETDFLARYNFPGLVTRDSGFLRVLETVVQAAATDLPVLVLGPSGSGKELIARAVHLNSPRSKRSFLAINCGAISPQLLESELFGHVRGAFTGATMDKAGLIRSAHTGTVLLDEVGELPKDLQVKLLRTLQFGEVQPVGSAQVEQVDVRFVAATNRDLERDAREGRFREDLLYRLNAVTLELPALKDRPDDVLPLFYHFLGREAGRTGRPMPEVSPRLERVLQSYDWPGNVRELENEARRLYALTPPGLPLTADRLSRRIAAAAESVPALAAPAAAVQDPGLLPTAASLASQEKELIELHLRAAGGNRTRAAQSLGISRDGLRRKMQKYGLS
jgi:transcriptional regulator with GAF, ATPase, and Fis domain